MKIHKFLLSILLFVSVNISMAQKYASSASEISFYSDAPLEKIQATNKDGKSVINPATKEMAFVVSIRGFHFEKPLMEEHFNENYLESDKYKTANYKATITGDFDLKKDGVYEVTANGKMNIHGVEKDYSIPGRITVNGNKVSVDAKFIVKISDHKIQVPQLVIQNIAEVVEVTVHFDYEEKK